MNWEVTFWFGLVIALAVPAREWWRKSNEMIDHLFAATVVLAVIGVALASPYFEDAVDSFAPVSEDALREIGASLVAGSVVGFLFVLLERSLAKASEDEKDRQDFRRMVMMGERFIGLDARKQDLSKMHLRGKAFAKSDFTGANLSDSNLDEVDFNDAILRDADLTGARLRGAHLARCDAVGAKLDGADLAGCHFATADFRNCSFDGASMRDAWLGAADLGGAKLARCDLRGAHLVPDMRSMARNVSLEQLYESNGWPWPPGAEFEDVDFFGAIHDETTEWPEGFAPPTS